MGVCLPVCLPDSVYMSFCLSVWLSVCLFVRMTICLSLFLSICLTLCLSLFLSVWLSICMSVCLSVSLYVCLSVCLPICLSLSPFIFPVLDLEARMWTRVISIYFVFELWDSWPRGLGSMWGDFIFEYFEFFTSSVSILQVQQMEGSLYCAGTALLLTIHNHAVQPIASSFLNEGAPQFTLCCLFCTLIKLASSTTYRSKRVFPVVFFSQRHFIIILSL